MELKHYICSGNCKGISQNPGICQSQNCDKYNQELSECLCGDGLHGTLSRKKKKILFFIIFTPVFILGLFIAYLQIKSDGIDDLLSSIVRSDGDFSGKITDLILREGDYVCSFNDPGYSGSDYYGYNGVAYISGTNALVEIITPDYMGSSFSAKRSVKKDDYLYLFYFRERLNSDRVLPKNIDKEKFNFVEKVFFSENSNLNQSHEFQCKKWKPDYSLFEIPGDLENLEIENKSTIKNNLLLDKQNSELLFTQCVKESGAVFYGTFWCPSCNQQKKLFSSSENLLPYVECSTPDGTDQTQICKDKKITSYPYWVFPDGTSQSGVMSLTQISQKTGCAIDTDIYLLELI